MRRIPIGDLPDDGAIRFNRMHEVDERIIEAIKQKKPYNDMRWDWRLKKMVLFEINPYSGNILDINHYNLDQIGMSIADNISEMENPKTFRIKMKERDRQRQERLKKYNQEEYAYLFKQDKKVWREFVREMILSKGGNPYHKYNQKKPWWEFVEPHPELTPDTRLDTGISG